MIKPPSPHQYPFYSKTLSYVEIIIVHLPDRSTNIIVSSSHVMMVPLSLLALRNVTVEMMKLELTKLTSAFIEDDSGPLLTTGELKNILKPNVNSAPCLVNIIQSK